MFSQRQHFHNLAASLHSTNSLSVLPILLSIPDMRVGYQQSTMEGTKFASLNLLFLPDRPAVSIDTLEQAFVKRMQYLNHLPLRHIFR